MSQWIGRGKLSAFALVASIVVVVGGLVVIAGWLFGVPAMIRLLAGPVALNPMAAALFVLAGAALWRLNLAPRSVAGGLDGWALFLGALVAVAGGLKLFDYLFGLGFHLEHLLFAGKTHLTSLYPPSEMAPSTALNFLFCGLALLLIDIETPGGLRPAQFLALAAGLVSMLVLIGYSYHMLSLSRLGAVLPMSFSGAILFSFLSLGLLASRPDRGLLVLLTSRSTAGAMARRLLPMAILIPWLVGALLLMAEQAGYYSRDFAISMFAVASIVIFTLLIWWNVKLLYAADLDRARAERRLDAQHNSTRVLAESSSLRDALPKVLQVVCGALDWQVGVLWVLEGPSKTLHFGEAWREIGPEFEEFVRACRERTFGRGEGLPGRVWALLHPVWFPDFKQEDNLPRAELAARAGLHAAVGIPVWQGQEIFGTLEFFSRRIEPPDEALLEMLATIGTQVGLFIERTRAEQRLRQTTENLERSNTDLQQFAYVASHDLFEPLRMVTSYLQLLEQRHSHRLEPQAREFIGYALEGAKRMEDLIHDLLAYSRVDSRGNAFEPTDCERVFEAAVANLKVAIEESGAIINHGLLPRVRADRVQLTQVFQNLIGNAIKFRGDRAPRIAISAERQNGEWLFAVRDNGIGFDPKFSERVFVLFQRLHTRHEYAGTGMGLAICKKIIERHGGKIWVDSTPGQGSTFFFTWPALAPAASASTEKSLAA